MTKPRVLIIDDNADYIELVQAELGRHYEVLTALDGLDGYALAVNTPLDAIVLDVAMPLVDGWTVLRKLRSNPVTRHVPVVICTALELDGVETLARRLGAVAVMAKPLTRSLTSLGEQIARLISAPH